MAYQKQLPPKSKNLSDWYNKLVLEAELADYGPAKGTMIFRPYGYGIWEQIKAELDSRIKAKGVDNAYFPIFIPESLLKKERDHIEGFAPELAVVTIGGGRELEEKLVVRPTSETIMYEAYSRWIQSWRDLPVAINQWNNAVRWEMRTYLFLRTTEFLWQEGHTAHATHEEAREYQRWGIETYVDIYQNVLAMPGYMGKKSAAERFAGAVESFTYETLMPEGKALQSSTSHDLGQNFSKPFDIKFQDQKGKMQNVWQTSWGFSSRSIGGLIMTHGDDQGLILPPKAAPTQVVIIPVQLESKILNYCRGVQESLEKEGLRVTTDLKEEETLGFKINKWELKGVPVRIEVGAKEVSEEKATLSRRDSGKKQLVALNQLPGAATDQLEGIQTELYRRAEKFLKDNTRDVDDYGEFKEIMESKKGFIRALWCEDPNCEAKIHQETHATTRCLPLDARPEKGKCIYCGKPAQNRWLFAQAY